MTSRYGIIILLIVSYCLGFFSDHYFAYINYIQSAPINNYITLTITSLSTTDTSANNIIDQPPPMINDVTMNTSPSAVCGDKIKQLIIIYMLHPLLILQPHVNNNQYNVW